MTILLLIFGLFSGCALSVLVGLLGSKRNIGFGWAFVLSLLFTPLVGLIITLLSNPRGNYDDKNWGCLGYTLSALGLTILIGFFSIIFIYVLLLMLGVIF